MNERTPSFAAAVGLAAAIILCVAYLSGAQANSGRGANASASYAAALWASPQIPVLNCQPCELMHCVPRKASRLKCRGGTTTGICGCCPECAKVEGEDCGGDYDYLGKCDAGLYCSPRSPAANKESRTGIPEGRCRRIRDAMMDSSVPAGVLRDIVSGNGQQATLRQVTCEPKCTPDFCERKPKAICSAIDVVDMKRDCHGRCQHTSCQACSWIEPPADCGACKADDFECLRRFSSCVRKQHCTRDRFPCQARTAISVLSPASRLGKFQCEIPRCQER